MATNDDALTMLTEDHRRVDLMFEGFARATVESRETLFEEIKHELDTHAALEEELFYPAVKATGGNAGPLIDKAERDHFGLKTLLASIAAMPPEDGRYMGKIEEVRRTVREHVKEEEERVFPEARQRLGDARLRDLAAQMGQRKANLRKEMADFAP